MKQTKKPLSVVESVECMVCGEKIQHRTGKQQRGLKTIIFNQYKCSCVDKWRGAMNWPENWHVVREIK